MKRLVVILVGLLSLTGLLAVDVALGDGGAGTLWDSARPTKLRAAGLTGASEVPGPGHPSAYGIAHATFDRRTTVVCVDLSSSGLGNITGMHIHDGDATTAGPVVLDLGVPGPNGSGCALPASRSVFGAIWSNPSDYYVNVHTDKYPAGAIRGQLGPARVSRLVSVLQGSEEVPPADPDGAGVVDIEIHRPTGVVCTATTLNGIGAPTAAHIHTGLRGVNGPVLIGLGTPTLNKTVFCTQSDDADDVWRAPRTHYVNIHNAAYPAGAIRGQIKRIGSTR